MPGKTLYEILGVSSDAEGIVIKAAYRALAQKYHPDKLSGQTTSAEERMKEINLAYEILSDVDRRRKYDERIRPSISTPHSKDPQREREPFSSEKVTPHRKQEDFLQKKWKESSFFGKVMLYVMVTLLFGIAMGLVKVILRMINT